MSDNWNDETVPRHPSAPQYPAQPAAAVPQRDPARGVQPRHADETAWVRSIYLFGACATGGVLMIVGLLLFAGSLVSIVSPDSGLRDGWDRGLVGATQVADEGLVVFDEFTQMQLEDDFDRLCDRGADDPFCEDLADRIEEEASAIPDELTDSIALIRNEVHRQIRVAAIAKLVAGLALAIIGFVLFRLHSRHVTVYARK